MLTDIAGGGGAQDSINQRVGDRIGVRVSGKTARVGNPDSSQHQRTTLRESMRIVADADSNHAATVAGSSMME